MQSSQTICYLAPVELRVTNTSDNLGPLQLFYCFIQHNCVKVVADYEFLPRDARSGKRQFSVLSLAVSSEALEVRSKLLYSIIYPLSPFRWPHHTWTWMNLNGHFTLNSVFFVNSSSKFAYFFIRTTPSHLWWDHRETTYIYACWKFVTCFSEHRLTAMSSTNKELNKNKYWLRLIAYSNWLSIARFIASDGTRVCCI